MPYGQRSRRRGPFPVGKPFDQCLPFAGERGLQVVKRLALQVDQRAEKSRSPSRRKFTASKDDGKVMIVSRDTAALAGDHFYCWHSVNRSIGH